MTRLEKLTEEFMQCRGPFPYARLVTLLEGLGFENRKTGSGSSRKFVHIDTGQIILLHEPHPQKEIKPYMVRQIQTLIEQADLA